MAIDQQEQAVITTHGPAFNPWAAAIRSARNPRNYCNEIANLTVEATRDLYSQMTGIDPRGEIDAVVKAFDKLIQDAAAVRNRLAVIRARMVDEQMTGCDYQNDEACQ